MNLKHEPARKIGKCPECSASCWYSQYRGIHHRVCDNPECDWSSLFSHWLIDLGELVETLGREDQALDYWLEGMTIDDAAFWIRKDME